MAAGGAGFAENWAGGVPNLFMVSGLGRRNKKRWDRRQALVGRSTVIWPPVTGRELMGGISVLSRHTAGNRERIQHNHGAAGHEAPGGPLGWIDDPLDGGLRVGRRLERGSVDGQRLESQQA